MKLFQSLFEDANTEYLEAKLPQIHSQEILKVLQRFTTVDKKLGDYEKAYNISVIFDETYSQRDGLTVRREDPTFQPKKPEDVVLSGPHIFVGNPLNKNPRNKWQKKRTLMIQIF
ncbi:MAG: hypothetical protein IPG24_14505 [Leptospiraceae bacterium]|nr:hypothetical protein [Leptospiraceae bacterium]